MNQKEAGVQKEKHIKRNKAPIYNNSLGSESQRQQKFRQEKKKTKKRQMNESPDNSTERNPKQAKNKGDDQPDREFNIPRRIILNQE